MGRVLESIDDNLSNWISQQHLYFVGTAPNGPDGHVNISPKGSIETFAVLGEQSVAYLDFVGSGIETIAHLRENGRIVVMFCSFPGPPKIVRLHGRGRVVFPSEPEFSQISDRFTVDPDIADLVRSAIVIDVERISDSCGFGVPLMSYKAPRNSMQRWAETKHEKFGPSWMADYMTAKNAKSIDGLPGLLISDPSHD